MASGTNYSQEYGQAEKAYLESDFARAAEVIDRLAEEFPDDPNVMLLRGHIYCYGFQNYDLAKHQYQSVLDISDRQDLLDFARSGIEQVEQLQQQSEDAELSFDEDDLELPEIPDDEDLDTPENSVGIDFPETEIATSDSDFDGENFEFESDYQSELDDSDSARQLENHSSFTSGENSHVNSFVENARADLQSLSLASADTNGEDSEELSDATQASEIRTGSTFMVDSYDDLPDYTAEDFAVEQRQYENRYDDNSDIRSRYDFDRSFCCRKYRRL